MVPGGKGSTQSGNVDLTHHTCSKSYNVCVNMYITRTSMIPKAKYINLSPLTLDPRCSLQTSFTIHKLQDTHRIRVLVL